MPAVLAIQYNLLWDLGLGIQKKATSENIFILTNTLYKNKSFELFWVMRYVCNLRAASDVINDIFVVHFPNSLRVELHYTSSSISSISKHLSI